MRRRRRWAGRAVTVSVAAVLGALPGAVSPAHGPSELFQAMGGSVATPPAVASAVTFRDLDGQTVTLDAFRGRPVLMTFFTTW